MQFIGEVIFVNLHILVLSQGQVFRAQEGIFGWNQCIFPPEKRQSPDQIPFIQVVYGIHLPFCWDLLMSHNFLKNQDPKKKKKYYQIS